MKTLSTILATLALTATACAVEYVTLNVSGASSNDEDKPPSTRSLQVNSTSLVQIVAAYSSRDPVTLDIAFSDGTKNTVREADRELIGEIFTGISGITVRPSLNDSSTIVTLKITPIEELNSIASGVVTLPAGTGDGYAVTLEQSTDLINFDAVSPGMFTGATTPQFFRVRLQKQ